MDWADRFWTWMIGLLGVSAIALLGLGPLIPYLCGAMTLDLLAGSILAGSRGKWRAAAFWLGLAKKIMTLILVMTAGILEPAYAIAAGGDSIPDISNGACFFFLVWEAGSIIENAGRLGAPIPPVLREALALLRRHAPPGGTPPGGAGERP